MKILSVSAIILLIIASCNNNKKEKENVDGGPCSYKEEAHPAKLLSLQIIDSLSYDAQFEIEAGSQSADKPDTVLFHSLNNHYIEAKKIKSDTITVGKTYKYIVKTIVSGSCDPTVRIISLEKY